jgi:phospholipase A1
MRAAVVALALLLLHGFAAAAEPAGGSDARPGPPPGAAGGLAGPPPPLPLEGYLPVYFVSTWDGINHPGREAREMAYQISFRVPLWRFAATPDPDAPIDRHGLYFAYTQKSFWQVWDSSAQNSRSFRESDFAPELVTYTAPDWRLADRTTLSLQFTPWQHESNGQALGPSKSWDRTYARASLRLADLLVGVKHWWRWGEGAAAATAVNSREDDNPDIEFYLGRFELTLVLPYRSRWEQPSRWRLETFFRQGWREDSFTAQVDLGVLLSERVYLIFHTFDGYGESLIDYKTRVSKVGVGFAAY